MVGIILGGGGSSNYSDDLSATANQVISGYKYIGYDTDDNIGIGTLPKAAVLNQYGGQTYDGTIGTLGATTYTPNKANLNTEKTFYIGDDITIESGRYLGGNQTIKGIKISIDDSRILKRDTAAIKVGWDASGKEAEVFSSTGSMPINSAQYTKLTSANSSSSPVKFPNGYYENNAQTSGGLLTGNHGAYVDVFSWS